MAELTQKIITELKKLASSDVWYDEEVENLDVYDLTGGNLDDAFSLGEHTGKVELAREILSELNIEWW